MRLPKKPAGRGDWADFINNHDYGEQLAFDMRSRPDYRTMIPGDVSAYIMEQTEEFRDELWARIAMENET